MSTKTINLIAQLAGVSRSTVSRVLNDNPSVNAATRAKVQRVIQEQGYEPNRFARTISAAQHPTIGVVIPVMHDPFYSLLISGAEDACRTLGVNIMLREGGQSSAGEKRAIEELLGLGCDSLVVYVERITDNELSRYLRRQPKMILLDRNLPDAQEKCLWVDHIQGGKQAAQILIERGRIEIAAILSHRESRNQSQIWQGALEKFTEAGITLPSTKIIRTGNNIQDGRVAMRQLLALGLKIDGLFCDNDALAIGAMQALKENGISVPHDIGVVGYDDLEFSAYCVPRLTTIKMPIYDLAYRAACELIDHTSDVGAATNHAVKADESRHMIPSLILRESA